MNRSIVIIIFVLLFVFLFLTFNCGIEYQLIQFKAPFNFQANEDDRTKVEFSFNGENQEEDGSIYLLVGYDIYYFFTSDSIGSAKLANVKNPEVDLTHDNDTKLFGWDELNGADRFPLPSFTEAYLDTRLYKNVTIPIPEDNIIEDILKSGKNDNIKFYFHDIVINDGVSKTNPYQINNDSII